MLKLREYQISMFLKVARRGIVMADGPQGVDTSANSMRSVRLDLLAKQMNPISVSNLKKTQVTALVWDSRQVIDGCIFFAVKGESFDGNDYIAEAVRKGAIAIVTDDKHTARKDVACVVVEDVRIALAKSAHQFYDNPDQKLNVVGVTGTNGKTTVSRLTKYLLDGDNNECGLIGTIEYVVGGRVIPSHKTTPEVDEVCALMAEMLDSGCNHAVMEVSSHGVDQNRVYGVGFDTVAFLNLTREHLDYHGTMDEYFSVKSRLFKGHGNPLPKNAVINVDEDYGRKLVEEIAEETKCLTFSCKQEADFEATDIHLTETGSSFTLNSPEGIFRVKTPFLGTFNVSNVLASIACAFASGKKIKHLVDLLASAPAIPGRLEIIDEGQNFLTVVDYAHTDDALDNVLHTVRSISDGRLIVVFGCGGDRDRSKRSLMMQIACRYGDIVIATSDNPRTEKQSRIFDDMLAGVNGDTRVSFIEDREEAIKKAVEHAENRDAVVIAGKGHEAYQILNDSIIPFDDRLVARAAIRESLLETSTNLGVK